MKLLPEILDEMQAATRIIVYNLDIETDINVHTLPVTKLKIFSLSLVKQKLFSGLLIDRGKKLSFAGFSETDSRKNRLIWQKF